MGGFGDGGYHVMILDHNVPSLKGTVVGDAVGEVVNLAFGVARVAKGE